MNFQTISDFIKRNDAFVITAHETPDADALGAEIAMCSILEQLGKRATILNADPAPLLFEFITKLGRVNVLKDESSIPDDIAERALIILDVNDIRNIGAVSTLILPNVREYFILDHHEHEESVATGNLIEVGASSACEILFTLAEYLEVTVTLEMATALFAGIVFDTGSFVYQKTSAKTFDVAKKLVEIGVVPSDIYTRMYESNSISFLVLQSRVLASLELYYDEQVAVQSMLKSMLTEVGANYEEGQSLINVPLRSSDVRVSVFFKENDEGLLRCSLRSKGQIDVASIAQSFGGGGHRNAAGFKCSASLNECKREVLEQLRTYFE